MLQGVHEGASTTGKLKCCCYEMLMLTYLSMYLSIYSGSDVFTMRLRDVQLRLSRRECAHPVLLAPLSPGYCKILKHKSLSTFLWYLFLAPFSGTVHVWLGCCRMLICFKLRSGDLTS